MDADVLVIGAGFSGLTFARAYAQAQPSKRVVVCERRDQLGGNCHDYETEDGIIVQRYGPHIFHTDDKRAWDFMNSFTSFNGYEHRVIAKYRGVHYPVPINLTTVNRFFGLELSGEQELREFLEGKRERVDAIKTSEDVIVSRFGRELYDAFFKEYTKKQWGVTPDMMPPFIFERLPLRYDDNDLYYNSRFQGMPEGGFTRAFERMVDLPDIEVMLGREPGKDEIERAPMVIHTGRIDEHFSYVHGRLPYRNSRFEFQTLETCDYQPNSVVNHTEGSVECLRSTEYKKFYGTEADRTVICFEYMDDAGVNTYPVINEDSKETLKKYEDMVPDNMRFLGRLGRHRYLDMDKACIEALELAEELG